MSVALSIGLCALAQEIELKVRLADPGAVRARLRTLGAQCQGRVQETNRIFDTGERRLLASDWGLRIREAVLLEDG